MAPDQPRGDTMWDGRLVAVSTTLLVAGLLFRFVGPASTPQPGWTQQDLVAVVLLGLAAASISLTLLVALTRFLRTRNSP